MPQSSTAWTLVAATTPSSVSNQHPSPAWTPQTPLLDKLVSNGTPQDGEALAVCRHWGGRGEETKKSCHVRARHTAKDLKGRHTQGGAMALRRLVSAVLDDLAVSRASPWRR